MGDTFSPLRAQPHRVTARDRSSPPPPAAPRGWRGRAELRNSVEASPARGCTAGERGGEDTPTSALTVREGGVKANIPPPRGGAQRPRCRRGGGGAVPGAAAPRGYGATWRPRGGTAAASGSGAGGGGGSSHRTPPASQLPSVPRGSRRSRVPTSDPQSNSERRRGGVGLPAWVFLGGGGGGGVAVGHPNYRGCSRSP